MSAELVQYYGRRAAEYERIYQKPERQPDLGQLARMLRRLLLNQDVLELACGTGFWTEKIAPGAASLVATDVSAETLALAREKQYPAGKVSIERGDAYAPEQIPGRFTAGFAAFWWSHVPRKKLGPFLERLHRRLGRGALVVFCDNRYVEGSSTPICRTDSAGDTYQLRALANGERYEVLKNFPSPVELQASISGAGGVDIVVQELTYYWSVWYRVGSILP
jgi:demethylmenaquinone methyltransferase/2-methoxy-6-polyprenyl-1,4-benzoquinol methylase